MEPDYSNEEKSLGKKNTSGHHYKSGACSTVSCVMTWYILYSETGSRINRHSPKMNLVEEKQRGLIPPGLQSWPLQLIEHFSNTTSVVPPPADPAGCRPLYLLHLLNLSFTIRAPNGGCILQFRAYQSFVCILLSTPMCESEVPSKET